MLMKWMQLGLSSGYRTVEKRGNFNEPRPHQGIDNKIPAEYKLGTKQQGSGVPNIKVENVRCHKFIGGLLKSYIRAA